MSDKSVCAKYKPYRIYQTRAGVVVRGPGFRSGYEIDDVAAAMVLAEALLIAYNAGASERSRLYAGSVGRRHK